MQSEPLQLGQVLYPVQDTTLICVPKGKTSAVHQRIGFSGTGEHVVAKGQDVLDLAGMATLQGARVIANVHTGRQELVVLRQDDLEVIAHDDAGAVQRSTLRLVPPDFVRFATRGAGTSAQRPGETVGHAIPWYTNGDAVLTIGYDPLAGQQRILALLAAAGPGFAVQFWDLAAGAKTAQVRLPAAVTGVPVAAELMRHGTATWLLVATVEEVDKNLRNPFRAHALKLHAVAWTDLSPQAGKRDAVDAGQLTTLTLATGVPGPVDPEGTVFKGRHCDYERDGLFARPPARAQISATLARLRKGVADQQLVMAWASGARPYKVSSGNSQPVTWSCHVAVVGCGPDGKIKVLAEADPDVWFGFAIPGAPIFRVVAADLQQTGVDQIVVGYPAFFGKMESTVALMLYGLDEPSGAAPVLQCTSRTVVAATAPAAPHGNGRWGEFYLYLAAGVFGDYKAVQIITTARDAREPQTQSIPVVCGFVPVHPSMGLPPFAPVPEHERNKFYSILRAGGTPALAQACQTLATIDWDVAAEPGYSGRTRSLRFFAMPSDLAGSSVVLGAPTFTQVATTTQILAIIQAPPYDIAVNDDLPLVTFNTANDKSTGYSVSTSKMWTVSDDTHLSAQLGGFSLSKSIHESHSKGLDNLDDTTVSSSVHLQLHTNQHDFMMVHEIGFDVWRYPVLRSSDKASRSIEVLVVYPKDHAPRLNMVYCADPNYGYRPNSEVGMLLSYCEFLQDNKKKLGFEAKNQLFEGVSGIPVLREKNGSTETFDASRMTSNTVGRNFSLLNSVSDSASIALQTELFDFLPAAFGLNLTHTESYSDHRVETTHGTWTQHFSLSISAGSVKDDIYSFKIIPYIYNHAAMGCLVVAWDVELTGENWDGRSRIEGKRRRFDQPDVRLLRVNPVSEDSFVQSHSRAISLARQGDGSVDVVVEMFNNSVVAATNVLCEIYVGEPILKRQAAAPVDELADSQTPAIKKLVPPDTLPHKINAGEIGAMGRVQVPVKGLLLDDSGTVTVRVSSDGFPVDTFGHVYWNTVGAPK